MEEYKRLGFEMDHTNFIYNKPPHEVLQVTLRSGEKFALDITGAQFGHYAPVLEWSQYSTERIESIESNEKSLPSYGTLDLHNATRWKILMQEKKNNAYFLGQKGKPIYASVLTEMNHLLLIWQDLGKTSIKDLLLLPQEKFEKKLENLVDYVDCNLHPSSSLQEQPYFTVKGRALAKKFGEKWSFEQ